MKDSSFTSGCKRMQEWEWDCGGIPEPRKGPQGMTLTNKPFPGRRTRDIVHSRRMFGRVGVA